MTSATTPSIGELRCLGGWSRRATQALSLSVDFYVTDSSVSPRETLERYRLECEVPVVGAADILIRVGDEQSRETYLATWERFEGDQIGLTEMLLRCFFLARFGAADLPAIEGDYPHRFDQVALVIRERKASEVAPALLAISAYLDGGAWHTERSFAGRPDNAQTWPLTDGHPLDPLALMWSIARKPSAGQ